MANLTTDSRRTRATTNSDVMATNSPLLTKKTTTDKLQEPVSKRPKRREVSNGRTTENVSKKARNTLYRTSAECLEGNYKSSSEDLNVNGEDDDDFEEPNNCSQIIVASEVRKYTAEGAQKDKGVKKVQGGKKGRGPSKNQGIKTRVTPKPLFDAVSQLNDEQKLVVAAMGLGGILHLKLTKVPSILGYWVLDAFNPENCSVSTKRWKFNVTECDVRNVLGLPVGGKTVDVKKRGLKNRVMIREWRKCFGTVTTEISCRDIVGKIKDTRADDPMFKMHFLVLFFSSMVSSTKNQWSDQRILNAIDGVDDIRSLNWSEYIIEHLITSKEIWDKERKANYTGPITFLLGVYMDRVDDRLAKFTRTRPAIKYLTDELIEERYRSLVKQGGFNKGNKVKRNDILDANSVGIHTVHHKLRLTEIPSPNEDVEQDSLTISFLWLQAQREAAAALRKAKETYEMTYKRMLGQEHFKKEYEKVHDGVKDVMLFSPVDKCDTISKSRSAAMNDNQICTMSNNCGFRDQLSPTNYYNTPPATTGFPHSTSIDTHQPEKHLKTHTLDTAQLDTTKETMHASATDLQSSKILPQQHEYITRGNNTPEQHKSPSQNQVDEDIEKFVNNLPILKPGDEFLLPMRVLLHGAKWNVQPSTQRLEELMKDDIPINMQLTTTPVLNPVPKNIVEQKQLVARKKKPGPAARSPYRDRVVSLDSGIRKDDWKLCIYIIKGGLNKSEIMFEWDDIAMQQEDFDTFRPHEYLSTLVIDAWSVILNEIEDYSSSTVKRRFYCTTHPTTSFIVNEGTSMEKCENFARILQKCFARFPKIFFPICEHQHFYIVCYDMNTGNADIIDNCAEDAPLLNKYGTTVDDLTTFFHYYLMTKKYKKANLFANSKAVRTSMPWRTLENKTDCGVFAMRHMETYKGRGVGKFKTGLHEEGAKQKKQLVMLRWKYLVEIITWEHNARRESLMKKFGEYKRQEGESHEEKAA